MTTLATGISVLDNILRRWTPELDFGRGTAAVGWTRASELTGETYHVYLSTTEILTPADATLIATNIPAFDAAYRYELSEGTDAAYHFAVMPVDATATPLRGASATWELNLKGTLAGTEGRVYLDHFVGQTFPTPGHELCRATVQVARNGKVGSALRCDVIRWRDDYSTTLGSLEVFASASIVEERIGTSTTTFCFPLFTNDLTSGDTFLLHFSLDDTLAGGLDHYYSIKLQNSINCSNGVVYTGQTRNLSSVDTSVARSIWGLVDQALYCWNPTVTDNLGIDFAFADDPSYRYTLARNPHEVVRSLDMPTAQSRRAINANLQMRGSKEKGSLDLDFRSSKVTRAQAEELYKFWKQQDEILVSYCPHAESGALPYRLRTSWPGRFGFEQWEAIASWDYLPGEFTLEIV